jgi:hypothetical protein
MQDIDLEGMRDPAFLDWLRDRCEIPVTPDAHDLLDLPDMAETEDAQEFRYQYAQARKIFRLYYGWKTWTDSKANDRKEAG